MAPPSAKFSSVAPELEKVVEGTCQEDSLSPQRLRGSKFLAPKHTCAPSPAADWHVANQLSGANVTIGVFGCVGLILAPLVDAFASEGPVVGGAAIFLIIVISIAVFCKRHRLPASAVELSFTSLVLVSNVVSAFLVSRIQDSTLRTAHLARLSVFFKLWLCVVSRIPLSITCIVISWLIDLAFEWFSSKLFSEPFPTLETAWIALSSLLLLAMAVSISYRAKGQFQAEIDREDEIDRYLKLASIDYYLRVGSETGRIEGCDANFYNFIRHQVEALPTNQWVGELFQDFITVEVEGDFITSSRKLTSAFRQAEVGQICVTLLASLKRPEVPDPTKAGEKPTDVELRIVTGPSNRGSKYSGCFLVGIRKLKSRVRLKTQSTQRVLSPPSLPPDLFPFEESWKPPARANSWCSPRGVQIHTSLQPLFYDAGLPAQRSPACPVGAHSGPLSANLSTFQARSGAAASWCASSHAFLKASIGDNQSFEAIIALGRKEHWILDSQEVIVDHNKLLGSGAYGTVKAGVFRGCDVAIKSAKDEKRTELPLLNELRLLRHVRHPNVVLFFGACINPSTGDIALIFELIEGYTLENFIKVKRPAQVIDSLSILLCVASALQYLHGMETPIVHGDLKDSNVFVERVHAACRAKLGDFGLSRLIKGNDNVRLGGTMRWMAPEVILGQTISDPSYSDVFSFGRLMSYTLTYKRPCSGLTANDIKQLAKQGQVPTLAWTCPAIVLSLVPFGKACVSFEPEERPSMVEITDQVRSCYEHCKEELAQQKIQASVSSGGSLTSSQASSVSRRLATAPA